MLKITNKGIRLKFIVLCSMVIWFFLLITLKKYLAFKIKTVKSFIDFVKDVWNLEWGMNEIEHMLIHMYFFI